MGSLPELLLRAPRRTLAVAESVTTGRLQARIGAVAGASHYFLGGITAYSLTEKVRHLGVEPALAAAVNGVSAEVAAQMARGACRLFASDLALATTGYAQPSLEWNVAQPFAWCALAHRHSETDFTVQTCCIDCPGLERTVAQEKIATVALDFLLRYLRELYPIS